MKPTVALVLGSGGARGIAHIGVIRELINQGYEISSISGTSMGALVGGIYAAGKLDEFEAWGRSLSNKDIINLIDITLSTNGLIKANKVLEEIQKFIPDQKIEDLPIKYSAITTDLKNKKEIVITKGSLFKAIRASISIPLVFTPIQKKDALFVDGGVVNPVPTNRVFRQDNDFLIAVNLYAQIPYLTSVDVEQKSDNYNRTYKTELRRIGKKIYLSNFINNIKNKGYVSLASDSVGLMLSQLASLRLELNPPDLLIEVSNKACGAFDFYKVDELIEFGKKITSESFNKLNQSE